MSIFSGIIGNNSINCHQAREIGMKSIESIIGQNFETVKFTRKNRVLSIKTARSSLKINEEIIAINPLLIFQRLCININSKADMKKYLKFELSPFPLSIFTEHGFRKNVKSQLFDYFISTEMLQITKNKLHVIDGGYLLHNVVWQKYDTVEMNVEKYVSYVRSHYANDSCIVFDGYPGSDDDNDEYTSSSTKSSERARRKKNFNFPSFHMEPHTKITITQDKFLLNESNRIELIKLLSKAFTFEGYIVKQAEGDADSLIVNSALEISTMSKIENITTGVCDYGKNVIVVGQDIDLLVLLTQLNEANSPIFFLKTGAGNVGDSMYSCDSFKMQNYRSIVAFLHCFTGCDTVSGFAGKGKKATVDSLLETPNLTDLITTLYDPKADPRIIARNGCTLIKYIYSCTDDTMSLDDLRFHRYQILTAKSTFHFERLPPTVGAAIQHCYRTYYQLQSWLGNNLNATKWGWKEVLNNNSKLLIPRLTDAPLVPDELLKKISCNCKSDCSSNRCGCCKHGLKCTVLCIKCQESNNCVNVEKVCEDSSDLEDIANNVDQPSILSSPVNEEAENEESEKCTDIEDENDEETDSPNLSDTELEVICETKRRRLL